MHYARNLPALCTDKCPSLQEKNLPLNMYVNDRDNIAKFYSSQSNVRKYGHFSVSRDIWPWTLCLYHRNTILQTDNSEALVYNTGHWVLDPKTSQAWVFYLPLLNHNFAQRLTFWLLSLITFNQRGNWEVLMWLSINKILLISLSYFS